MADRSGPNRIVPLVLVGLGVFLLVIAILLPAYSVGKLKKTPLDIETTSVASGTGSILDAASLRAGRAVTDQNVPLVSQRFVTTEDPSNSSTVTLQSGQTLRRTDKQGETGVLSAIIDRASYDRKTAQPVEPIGSIQADGTKPAEEVDHTGLTYKFPFDTEKTTYQYFDTTARQSFDLNFVEEAEVNGLPVYKYSMTIPPVDLSTVTSLASNKVALPADSWGVEGGAAVITMTRYYENTRELYIDPKTGVIVDASEQIHQYYARRAGTPEVDVIRADLSFDENTVDTAINQARDSSDQLALVGRTIPIIAGIVGLISLVVGLFLLFFRKGSGDARTDNRDARDPDPSGYATDDRRSTDQTERRDFTTDRTEEIPRTDLRKPPGERW